ncbi:MAG: fibronectin type III domain-containing protein [Candidatus Sulfotelmatobacter sp.]
MKLLIGKLLLVATAAGWLAGCASMGPPEAPSLELPKPPTDLHAARKGEQVTLTWTIPARTTDRQRTRYLGETNICRSVGAALKECGTQVGEAAPPADFEQTAEKASGKRLSGSFTDTLPVALEQEHPTEFASYAVEVLNTAGRGAGISNQARVALVPTLPAFGDFSAHTTAAGVLISWKCPVTAEGRRGTGYLFRIERRAESRSNETKVADVQATECALGEDESSSSFLDSTFEWEQTYFYRGTVVSVIETAGKASVEVEGDDTLEVKVFARDIFPPAVPSGLQAVFSGPGQLPFVDLIWTPVADADLDGYNVYRHEEGAAAVKINSGLVKTPAFRDTKVEAGKAYFYSVSAVDQRGNESARSEETSESVP